MVEVRLRPLVPENVLPMIGPERPAIFPLRVTDAVAVANRDPAIFADRMPLLHKRLPEPGHDDRRLRFELPMRDIVVGQRAIKWILPRDEVDRDVVMPARRIGVIEAAVVARPVRVPRALVIRHRIVRGRLFADPENGRDDVRLPRITRREKREVVGTKTCGSTLRSACARSFIAYLAKSALLS